MEVPWAASLESEAGPSAEVALGGLVLELVLVGPVLEVEPWWPAELALVGPVLGEASRGCRGVAAGSG